MYSKLHQIAVDGNFATKWKEYKAQHWLSTWMVLWFVFYKKSWYPWMWKLCPFGNWSPLNDISENYQRCSRTKGTNCNVRCKVNSVNVKIQSGINLILTCFFRNLEIEIERGTNTGNIKTNTETKVNMINTGKRTNIMTKRKRYD